MSDKKSEAIQQAELARLKAELAAAEARAALARAEADAAISSAELARAEADAASEPHDSAVALADHPEESSHGTNGTAGTNGANGTHGTNGNGKQAVPTEKQIAPPPALKDRQPSSWRDDKARPADPPVAEVKAVATEVPTQIDRAAKTDTAATAPQQTAGVEKGQTATAKGAAANKEAAKKTSAGEKSPATMVARSSAALADGAIPVVRDSEEENDPGLLERLLGKYAVTCMTSVSFSIIVHMVFLILLGMWFLPSMLKPSQELIAVLDETPLDEVTKTLDETLTPTSELAFTSSSMHAFSSSAGTPGVDAPSTIDKTVEPSQEKVKAEVGEIQNFTGQGGKSLTADLPEGSKGEPAAIVENYQQAMDRITQEILLRLSKGKVLVVWCLDESESMKDDIKEIRMRIDKVYTELGLNSAAQGDVLLTSVISYGAQMTVHTKQPTSDIERIRAAMDEVKIDESGMEMQCQTVGHAINQYRGFVTQGKRQMMLILVTDESGNQDENLQFVEPTIAEAKAARCPIYVLGREAVFGYPYAHMWTTVTVPAVGGGNVTRSWLLPIDRGPETPFVEQLQTEGFHRRHDTHASGFGPYEQVRMARETGGVFFMLPSPEVAAFDRDKTKNRKYALEAIRPYMPDLSSRMDYANERDKHPDRLTIWKVINDLNPYKPEIAKHIDMRMSFSPQPPTFANQVHAELQKSVVYYQYLGAAEKALEDLKKQRDREPLPRWQANYDLIYAQLLAYEARLWEYGAYLEAFIKTPKQFDPPKPDRQIDEWRIAMRKKRIGEAMANNSSETSERRARAQKNEALIARSTELFKAVIRDHEGTPWAARAEAELNRGFGVELNAHYYNPLYVAPRPVRPIVQPKL